MKTERILGISFFTGPVAEALEQHRANGGYVVIPAAPALIKLKYDDEYRRAMQNADLALADSGLLVWLWRMATGRRVSRISGINYFKHLLEQRTLQGEGDAFWIFPAGVAQAKAAAWLRERGVSLDEKYVFGATAPPSSEQDYTILTRIEKGKSKNVVIAMAGGSQEKLALYLRDYLLYRPRIHCIGAALDLLSGEQKPIPDWAERSHLGWLLRLFAQPRMFFPRIGIALGLAQMLFKYRSKMPPLKKRWADI